MKPQKIDIDNGECIIDADNIHKLYSTGKVKVEALKGVNLQVRRGEVVAIMGPSGCGKTTLLNCLSGLDDIDTGTIKIAGSDLDELSDSELTRFRARQMGFVFQNYNLLPVFTGVENVEFPLLISGVKPKVARERAMEVIAEVGLSNWANHKPDEMSGGQRQRITIARALAPEPAIIWADEPTGSLDSETSSEIIDLMLQLNQKNRQTFVWVTHALEVAMLTQRLILMRDGRIVDDTVITQNEQPLSREVQGDIRR